MLMIPLLGFSQLGGNYWNLNYGTKAQLLNGSVIGGIDDISSLYYNPAAIGCDTVGGISLSLLSPSYSAINTNSSQLNNEQLTSIDLLPNMAVIDFPFFKNSRIRSSLGIFSKRSFDIDFASQLNIDVNPNQDFTGIVNYRNKIDENFFAFGLSYLIADGLQIGLTQSLNRRSQTQTLLINGQSRNSSSGAVNERDYFSFFEFSTSYPSLTTKIGILFKHKKYSMGATITTPGYLPVLNSGRYQYIQPIFDRGLLQGDIEDTQSGLSSQYQSPWSFGIGGVYMLKSTAKLYFSTEYFMAQNPFVVLENENNGIPFRLTDARKAVLNIALGFEKEMSEQFTLLTGFRTDYNANSNYKLESQFDRDVYNFSWDIYNFSLGGHFSLRKLKFSAGVGYSFSQSNDQSVFNPFQEVYNSIGISEAPLSTEASTYQTISVFFNYSLLWESFSQ